jgi:hypothetical protein
MDIEKKKIKAVLSDFNNHINDCDVFDKGEVIISFGLMLKYIYLNISYHTRKNISYIFNN